jgi:putative phage-type endonuclease
MVAVASPLREYRFDPYTLGASQAPSAIGVSPFKAPIALWREYVEGAVVQADSPPCEWGLRLEPAVRQKYVDQCDVEVWTPPPMTHEVVQWARCSPDGIVRNGGSWLRGVEIKTAGYWSAHRWGDTGSGVVPPEYLVQCAWSMFVTGIPVWDIAVLIGGQDYRVYTLHRDAELEAEIVAGVTEFWECVQTKTPPPVDNSLAYAKYLADKMAGKGRDVVVEQCDAGEVLATELREAMRLCDEAEERESLAKNQIREFLAAAGATALATLHGWITWREDKNGKRAIRVPKDWSKEKR